MTRRWEREWYIMERSLLLRRKCPEVLENCQESWGCLYWTSILGALSAAAWNSHVLKKPLYSSDKHTQYFCLELTLLFEEKCIFSKKFKISSFGYFLLSKQVLFLQCYCSSLGMQVSVLQLSHLTVESLAHNFSSHKVQFTSWAIQDSWLLEVSIDRAGTSNLFKIPGVEIRKSLVVVTM